MESGLIKLNFQWKLEGALQLESISVISGRIFLTIAAIMIMMAAEQQDEDDNDDDDEGVEVGIAFG